MKTIDLNKNVYDLANGNDEFVKIMKSMGFDQMADPVVRGIIGKKMTVPLACKMRRMDVYDVIRTFEAKGFEVINKPMEEKNE